MFEDEIYDGDNDYYEDMDFSRDYIDEREVYLKYRTQLRDTF